MCNRYQVKQFLCCLLTFAMLCIPVQFASARCQDCGFLRQVHQNRVEVRNTRQEARQTKQATKRHDRYNRKTARNASQGSHGAFAQPSAGSQGGGYGVVYSTYYEAAPSNGSQGGGYQSASPSSSSCPYCTGNTTQPSKDQAVTTTAPQASTNTKGVLVVAGPIVVSVLITKAPTTFKVLIVKGPNSPTNRVLLAGL